MLAPPSLVLLIALVASAAPPLAGEDWCEDLAVESDMASHCEVRAFTLSARRELRVEASPYGGIHAQGGSGDGIQVRARVWTRSRTEARALALAGGVTVHTYGTLRYELAREYHSNEHPEDYVAVSYRLAVPRDQDLDLTSLNGGIEIEDVQSRIRYASLNGAVRLDGLGGDVQGHTLNGRVRVRLTGDAWQGRGLDATTKNGRVELEVPRGYSAELAVGTVNGRLRVDRGGLRGDVAAWASRRGPRQLDATLGAGGPPVRVQTINGRVQIAATP